ncbi:hypothetical protein [Francisella sp. SYW-2]|uniref:hypothetical protein n=1 Tax=Francisella sp. SYW-2 TaxID=2610886 RepID=UPI00123E40A6|nr:hypothetical protein [Francisella sp. SYW-2]
MEKVICFTSFTFSYIDKARLLAWSFKRFHPDWDFVALITDKEPLGFKLNLDEEYFDSVIWGQDLDVDNIKSWMFKHNIVEMCTAVKGPVLDLLANSGADKIIYLDPDIAVFETLKPIADLLDVYDIILTPHQLEPDKNDMAILDNEIGSLKYGIYNLGFVAISTRKEGRKFAKWWSDRLLKYCYDDVCNGLFTDQRWCDHVPVFFENVKILKDPGYNVASWNISKRKISITEDGKILVNKKYLLRFYHFTKFGPVGEAMTSRYAKDNVEVYELWKWYERLVKERFAEQNIPDRWWFFGIFENGEQITQEMRTFYKNRNDVSTYFINPYKTDFIEYFKNL